MPVVNMKLEGSRSSSCNGSNPHGNISISLTQRCQKKYHHPDIGREIILKDYLAGPKHDYPPIQFPPNAVNSPTFLLQELMALNLDHEMCTFLRDHISPEALRLSSCGIKGFHLSAQVEVVHAELVEDIEYSDDDDDDDDDDDEVSDDDDEEEEEERMIMKEVAKTVVDELSSRKRKREGIEGEICTVCLDELKEREREGSTDAVIGMPCGHFFHESCISQWLEEKFSCPMCRRGIHLQDFGTSSSSWIYSVCNS